MSKAPVPKKPVPPLPGQEAPDLCGRRVGDFQVLRRLGQGGMGEVYLAEQVSLHRKVALKILKRDLAANTRALERFKLEATAVAKATHANIVQVYAVGDEGGLAWMALEYVEGFNLRDFVTKKGPLGLPLALSVMRQVASALQRAAELGIIHRDIKPENILLTRKGEVKVADFGLSRCLEGEQPALNLTATGVTMGTPLYMSPEQVEGKPVDSRTDIYSFGVTCYHLLSGHPPFRGSTAFEVALAHVRTTPAPLGSLRPELPEALCAIVHKMMAKSPEQRYQTGRELGRDLARLRENMSGTQVANLPTMGVEQGGLAMALSDPAQPTPAVPPSDMPVARNWWPILGMLAVVAAGTSGAALAWRQRSQAGPLPAGVSLRPADATSTDKLHLPSKREAALVASAELYLAPSAEAPNPGGATVCMDLGQFYLDEYRYEDACSLFARMEAVKGAPAYPTLGHFGHGIALAMQNLPREANDAFKRISPRGKGAFRARLAPISQLLGSTRWRYYLDESKHRISRNGAKPADIIGILISRESKRPFSLGKERKP